MSAVVIIFQGSKTPECKASVLVIIRIVQFMAIVSNTKPLLAVLDVREGYEKD